MTTDYRIHVCPAPCGWIAEPVPPIVGPTILVFPAPPPFNGVNREEDGKVDIGTVFTDPGQLEGKGPDDIAAGPEWRQGPNTQGEHKGQGWTWHDDRDALLLWHPGGGHHGPDPYWKVSRGDIGVIHVPAGDRRE